MVGRCVEIRQVLVPPGEDNDDVHAHTHHGGTPPVHAVAPLYDHTLARLHNRYHHQDGARCRHDQPDTEDYSYGVIGFAAVRGNVFHVASGNTFSLRITSCRLDHVSCFYR
jgi:hypothetical protein